MAGGDLYARIFDVGNHFGNQRCKKYIIMVVRKLPKVRKSQFTISDGVVSAGRSPGAGEIGREWIIESNAGWSMTEVAG